MNDLRLSFRNGEIIGHGKDVVGEFVMNGVVQEDRVTLVKQYIDAHRVDYPGTFDGEGTLQGYWSIFGFGGRWMIKVVEPETDNSAIVDL